MTLSKKIEIIETFINNNIDAAVQGSKQWLDDRRFIIGGSEISTIIGCNSFSNLEGLIAQKVNLISFKGNTATRWGNLFENVSELLFSTMFNNKIYNTGSIQNKTIENHRYSPDGLCVVRFNDKQKITLLEFKSPFSSVPAAKIPKHYLPQVKAGLCTIDIAETALFVNNMFRKCSLKQLDFSIDYDNEYHRDTELKLKGIESAIANGIILFSISNENMHLFEEKFNGLNNTFRGSACEYACESDDESDTEIIDDGSSIMYKIKKAIESKTLIDFGIENKKIFDQFLELYKGDNSFINIKCVKPQINKDIKSNFIIPDELNYILNEEYKKYDIPKIIEKYTRICNKRNLTPIGVLPWKLLRSSHIIAEREESFLDDIKDKIDSAVNIINDIVTNSTSEDDIADNFEKHFIGNIITKKYYDDKPPSAEYMKDFL